PIVPTAGKPAPATGGAGTPRPIEPDSFEQAAGHVSQFDPDFGPGDQMGFGFTWITLERQEQTPQPPRSPSPASRPRLGWSLVVATIANLILGATAIITDATLVGVVACSALSIATCLLVLAEMASRYGVDPARRRDPWLDGTWQEDPWFDDR
ncbi:MAG: hypothetical protein AAF531_04450, partial [Actinomycetota bacterium]